MKKYQTMKGKKQIIFMEELPKTPELIGGSDKTREQVDSYFRDEYAENDLNYAEIPLSPEQQDIVRAVIEAIPEFLKTYGVEADPKAMLDRIHMIDDSKLAKKMCVSSRFGCA